MFLLIFPNIFIFNISIVKKKRTFGNMKCNFAHVSFLIDNVFDKFSWNKINLIRKIKCFSRRMRKIWSFASFWNFTLNIKYFTLICYISFSGLINKKKKIGKYTVYLSKFRHNNFFRRNRKKFSNLFVLSSYSIIPFSRNFTSWNDRNARKQVTVQTTWRNRRSRG